MHLKQISEISEENEDIKISINQGDFWRDQPAKKENKKSWF